jgi:transposase
MHLIRHRVQHNLLGRLPTGVRDDEVQFEADELYHTAGKKSDRHSDPKDPPRCRANKAIGRGTYEHDRPPIFILVARNIGEVRYLVRRNADSAACLEVVRSFAPAWASVLYTDELAGYGPVEDELKVIHYSVRHSKDENGVREWAKDVDGDGTREVHCNSCEGAGAGLRTYLRVFRGVHKKYLARYVAVY